MNSIFTIAPYKYNGQWVFDDSTKGLEREAFISGADDIIESMAQGKDKLVLLFSSTPFPGHQSVFHRGNKEMGGNWYHEETTEMSGWLCPALLKYFDTAPNRIFVQFKA